LSERVRFGVLISGGGTNLQALIDAASDPDYPAEIAVVVSNKQDAGGLSRARAAGIPVEWIPHKGKEREAFDAELVERLKAHRCEWIALAGFMRLVTPVFLNAFEGRVLNIHPALLPAFPGVRAQRQAYEAGVQVTGATVHLVDSGMDAGPIIAQGAVPRKPEDSLRDLEARILQMEHQLYPMVVRWAAQGCVRMTDSGLVVQPPEGEVRGLSWAH